MLLNMAGPLAKPMPFLKPKWRWLQFSLRTAFVVITVLCVGLTLWVVPAERQRRVVAAIEALGGKVRHVEPYQAASNSFPVTLLRRWLPPDYFYEIEYVWLSNTRVTDAGLAHLQGLMGLKILSLHSTQVTDAGLAHLKGLTGLQILWLNGTQVTDAGLAHLQSLTGLRWLILTKTKVTDAGVAKLRQALPGCQITGP